MTSGDQTNETKPSPRERLLAVQKEREATRVRATWPPVPDAEMLAAEAARKAEEAERHAAEEAEFDRRTIIMRARGLLNDTDYVPGKALERGLTLRPDWLAWREQLREVVRGNSQEIPEEPERYGAAPESVPGGNTLPEPETVAEADPEAIPAALASLANEGETAGEFFARMSPHLQTLLHRFVRGDKYSVDCLPLTDAEKIEFAETYAANAAAGNWLKIKT